MPFTPISKQFRRVGEGHFIKYDIPAVGYKFKNLIPAAPPQYVQFGYCLPSEYGNLIANEGDTTQTETLVTGLYGTINNCFKARVHADPVPAADPGNTGSSAGMIYYEIVWQQKV